jgi:hypothetical protein
MIASEIFIKISTNYRGIFGGAAASVSVRYRDIPDIEILHRPRQTIDIMKPTQTLYKRVARHTLSTKQTNKGYYKGTGSGSMGTHTKHGGFIVDWDKVRTYVVPQNLKDFKVGFGCVL